MKKELRKEYLKKRNLLTKGEIQQRSREITKKILSSSFYKKAEWIFTYININSEVETIPLIEQAWKDKKKIAVPIARKEREMHFVILKDFSQLRQTKMGVLEPPFCKENIVNSIGKQVLFFVPGSVFDLECNRFGYGGGYYDTYFEKYPEGIKLGLAYDFQVIEKLPVEQFDKKLDAIVTELKWIGGDNSENFK